MSYANEVRERLTRAALAAGIDPAEIEELLERESARTAAAVRPYEEALERVEKAAAARTATYTEWMEAVAAATQLGAPLRVVASHAGVSKTRVAQISQELIPA